MSVEPRLGRNEVLCGPVPDFGQGGVGMALQPAWRLAQDPGRRARRSLPGHGRSRNACVAQGHAAQLSQAVFVNAATRGGFHAGAFVTGIRH